MEALDHIEALEKEYADPFNTLLNRIGALMESAGWYVSGPHDLSDESLRWYINISKDADKIGGDDSIDITVQLHDQREYEGEDSGTGINFSVDIVEYGGRILGGLSPYNYTSDCWVDSHDPDAVAKRWKILEIADISEIPSLCEDVR